MKHQKSRELLKRSRRKTKTKHSRVGNLKKHGIEAGSAPPTTPAAPGGGITPVLQPNPALQALQGSAGVPAGVGAVLAEHVATVDPGTFRLVDRSINALLEIAAPVGQARTQAAPPAKSMHMSHFTACFGPSATTARPRPKPQ